MNAVHHKHQPSSYHPFFFHTHWHAYMHACRVDIDRFPSEHRARDANAPCAGRMKSNRTNKQNMYPQLRSRPLRIPKVDPSVQLRHHRRRRHRQLGTFSFLFANFNLVLSFFFRCCCCCCCPSGYVLYFTSCGAENTFSFLRVSSMSSIASGSNG